MSRPTRGAVPKLAALCGIALALRGAPLPRLSAGLDVYSLHLSLSLGGAPDRLRPESSGNGRSGDISLSLGIGADR